MYCIAIFIFWNTPPGEKVVEPGDVHVGDEVRVLKLGTGEVHRAVSDKSLKEGAR